MLEEIIIAIASQTARVGFRAFFNRDSDVVQRAIISTSGRFPKIESVETNLKQWITTESFVDLLERVHAGERDFEDRVVTSFIEEGNFYLPLHEERIRLGAKIVACFMSELYASIYRGSDGILALSNRQEQISIENKRYWDTRLAELETRLPSKVANAVAKNISVGHEELLDPTETRLAAKIDSARDLIDAGNVHSASVLLKQLVNDAQQEPEAIKFRIATNLGACALAEGDYHGASAHLEEAYRLQPENVKAIANASVAAQLIGNNERALKLALKARELEPKNSQATSVFIGELWNTGNRERLQSLIDEESWIMRDKQCRLVLSRVWMKQARFDEAIALCRSLVKDDPNDATARLALAQCFLNSFQIDPSLTRYGSKPMDLLHKAKEEADNALSLLQPTELSEQIREAFVTRSCANALLGETADALSDLDSVLKEAPTHDDALFNKGKLLLFHEDKPIEARALLESIREPRLRNEALVPLAVACINSGDHESAIGLLKGSFTLQNPTWKDVDMAELLRQAEMSTGREDSVGPLVKAALECSPNDPRLLCLFALERELAGDIEEAENAFLQAIQNAGDGEQGELSVRLGSLYRDQKRYSEAANQFSEVISDVPEHPLAINLLSCLVNGKRLREALSWARKIRRVHSKPPRMVLDVEAQILARIGDVRGALKLWEDLRTRSDAVPADLVRVAELQYACGERVAASATICRINPKELLNNPHSLMILAQLKLILGMPGYLDDAYLARRHGTNRPDVQMGYCGTFMSRDKGWMEPKEVGPGCAVLLKREASEQWWLILDDSDESLSHYEIPSTHHLARELLGRGTGDAIVLREGLEDLSYQIVAVQSKYVRAFQETIDEFSTRFPEHKGMYRVSFKDDDFSPLFQSVDDRYRLGTAAENFYAEGRLPFASFCSIMGKSVPEVWSVCTQGEFVPIRFGNGTIADAIRAGALLKDADVLTLDAVALLTVHKLGVIDHLRRRFSRVALPQQIVHDLQEEYALTLMASRPAGLLGKDVTGQYTLTEISEEGWREWREYLLSILEFAESLDSVPSYPLLDADDLEATENILTKAGAAASHFGYEEPDSKALLLCDDYPLSEYSRSIGTYSVNTQAALLELNRSNLISDEEYSRFVEQLVQLNYRLTEVRPEDIVRRLEASGFTTTDGIRAMLKTLEGPVCSEDAALSVAAEVIVRVDGKALVGQTELILSMLVSTLKRGRDPERVLPKFKEVLASMLTLAPFTRDRLMKSLKLHMQTSTAINLKVP